MTGLLLAFLTLASAPALNAQQPSGPSTVQTNLAGPLPATWDTLSDTWVASDALGRSLPSCSEAGLPRQHRTVGVFYFLWLYPSDGLGPFDISQILAKDPQAITNAASPLWGPMHAFITGASQYSATISPTTKRSCASTRRCSRMPGWM